MSLRSLRLGAAAAIAAALVVPVAAAAGTGVDADRSRDGSPQGEIVPRPPSLGAGAWVARIVTPTTARRAPAAGAAVAARLASRLRDHDHPTELLVLRSARDRAGALWLQVRLDRRPNTASGWVRADLVRLRQTRWWVRVDLSARTITVHHAGRRQLSSRVVVGAPATPTPHGLFALQLVARQTDPGAFLGPWALHLTAHSQVLEDFGGGPGRVAIHGRAGASLLDPLGTARSHGCIRVDNAVIGRLARVLRPGTPIEIRR